MSASLEQSERVSLALRGLYQSYGYRQYKVGKFEEYDLYAQNRNFLSDEHILSFSDINGRLMALKPDVTLSIIKNTRDDHRMRKVWYTENVYRVPRGGYGFQEILQTGLECIGAVDLYTMSEVVMLAARSLETISPDYVLDLSHMGIVTELLAAAEAPRSLLRGMIAAMSEKNAHAMREFCGRAGFPAETTGLLTGLCALGGPAEEVLPKLDAMPLPEGSRAAARELSALCGLVKVFGDYSINIDLSVTNDTDYYNGVLFRGFVDGAAAPVLSGGRYDHLLNRMGKTGGAIGFAVYLSELERFFTERRPYDVDTLLVYDENADPAALAARAKALADGGRTVRVQPRGEAAITYRELIEEEP